MATQMRIQATKDKLDTIKNIKMMGLVDTMEAKILEARKTEMKQYVLLCQLQVVFIVSGKSVDGQHFEDLDIECRMDTDLF